MSLRKLKTRFADWVDSHGEDAGDNMIAGMMVGALVLGLLGIALGLAVNAPAMVVIGFAVFMVHIIYVMAVL